MPTYKVFFLSGAKGTAPNPPASGLGRTFDTEIRRLARFGRYTVQTHYEYANYEDDVAALTTIAKNVFAAFIPHVAVAGSSSAATALKAANDALYPPPAT